MKIHFVGLQHKWLVAMLKTYEQSEPRLHELVDDPAIADIIMFLGAQRLHGEGIADSPLTKLYPEKCFIYWDSDDVVPILPGVYTNAVIPRVFDLHRTESQMFTEILNPNVVPRPNLEKRYLFSFMGGSTSIVRKKLYKIDYGRPDVLIRNTSDYFHWDATQPGREARQKEYADTIAASHFGLCPRGASAGGLRLFEVMQMGVAPVLISDRFRLPEGPDWDRFLVRIPERQLRQIPEILEKYVSESAERGRLAREAWEEYFAPHVVFNRIIEAYVRIRTRRVLSERWIHLVWGYMLWRHRSYYACRNWIKKNFLHLLRKAGLYRYDLNVH